jgi:hypothetical protein
MLQFSRIQATMILVEAALTTLRELSQEFNGVRPTDVVDVGDGLIRLIPTDAGVREYEPPIVARSIADIRARLSYSAILATVEREGANRLRIQVPTLGLEEIGRRMPP